MVPEGVWRCARGLLGMSEELHWSFGEGLKVRGGSWEVVKRCAGVSGSV